VTRFMEGSTCRRPRSWPDEEPIAAPGKHMFDCGSATTIRPQSSQWGCRDALRLPVTRLTVIPEGAGQVQNGFRAVASEGTCVGRVVLA
jgi:hypothetical protein